MRTTVRRYHVIIRKEGKDYIADVPTLGISDFGRTLEEAKRHIHKAIECHVEGMVKTGFDIPAPDTSDYYISFAEINLPKFLKLAV